MLEKEWNKKRIGVMYQAAYAKFAQDEPLKRFLLDTGDAPLVQAMSEGHHDRFWGVNYGTGRNMFGQILMRVREDLRTGLRPDKRVAFDETIGQAW